MICGGSWGGGWRTGWAVDNLGRGDTNCNALWKAEAVYVAIKGGGKQGEGSTMGIYHKRVTCTAITHANAMWGDSHSPIVCIRCFWSGIPGQPQIRVGKIRTYSGGHQKDVKEVTRGLLATTKRSGVVGRGQVCMQRAQTTSTHMGCKDGWYARTLPCYYL